MGSEQVRKLIAKLIMKYGSLKQVCDVCNVSRASIHAYITWRRLPSDRTLHKLLEKLIN